MEPHLYILDLLHKFNERTDANYNPSRGYSIMQCYVENKIEYYPTDYNKYDWLFGIICKNYVSHSVDNIITLPHMLYNSSIYAFLILDYYKATTYDDLFNVIQYNMKLTSGHLRKMSMNKDLLPLITELSNNRSKFVGAHSIFNVLCPNKRTMNSPRRVTLKRTTSDVDELDLDFKCIKLE